MRVSPQRDKAVLRAEITRDAHLITNDDLMSRSVELRRRAMQALARIADAKARPALERGLSDEDPEVVAWAAFGLGRACEQSADVAVNDLAIRAATWALANPQPPAESRVSLNPVSAITKALGRCGTSQAEATLRDWLRLEAPLADSAAVALGTIASRQHRLETTTLVALLDAADSRRDVPAALFAFSRLSAIEPNVQRRLLAVATKAIASKSESKPYAVRALSLAGDAAIPHLEHVATDKAGATAAERADAVRCLARLGDAGQSALGRVLARLASNLATDRDRLLTEEFGPLAEVLEHLSKVEPEAKPTLEAMAKRPLLPNASAAVQRRIVLLRCQAAAILAGRDTNFPPLSECDPAKDGRSGAMALSRVLGRTTIRGHRAQLFEKLANSDDVVVREHSLHWLQSHPEIRDSARILADALQSDVAGVVATAASVLAEHPERAQNQRKSAKASQAPLSDNDERAVRPTPEILLALGKAARKKWDPDAIDVRAQLLDAVASLGALSEKGFIDEQCRSSNVVLRQHAEAALHRLGDAKHRCPAPSPPPSVIEPAPIAADVHLRFHTDIGPLDLFLESRFAPQAAARLLTLVKQGFFTNVPVHRVVSGFVVQAGDRDGDGFGGSGLDVLPDELTPVPFRTNDVGLALSGPNTASSQFFVVLGPHPHLDGEYTRIGRAEPGWNRLVVGDVIERAEAIP